MGREGAVVHSNDFGATWTAQSINTSALLRGVAFADTVHGWAVGESGVIARTSDGGEVWNVYAPQVLEDLNSTAFVGAGYEGWVVGNFGTILHTTDGGQLWESQNSFFTGHLSDVFAVSANDVWLVGDYGVLLHTTSGGEDWTQALQYPYWLGSVAFTSPQMGCAVGTGGTIIVTTDGGQTWEPVPSGTTELLNRVRFADGAHGCAVGDHGVIRYTTDGGQSWNSCNSPTTATLYDVSIYSNGNGFAVGTGGTVLHTTSFGSEWSSQSVGSSALYDVECVTEDIAWTCGVNGSLFLTMNGGQSWESVTAPSSHTMHGLAFTQGSRYGWAVGEAGTIWHLGGAVNADDLPSVTIPETFSLSAYPNPFNPSTTLRFDLPTSGRVQLAVYNVTGRLVERMADRILPAGSHEMIFDGSGYPSGIYFARIEVAGGSRVQKLVLMK